MNPPLRIAVDAHRLMCEPRTSGATYLGGLVSEWSKFGDSLELFLLFPRPPSKEFGAQFAMSNGNIRMVAPSAPVNPIARYRAQFFWQQKTVAALLRRIRPDVYFSPFHLTPLLPMAQRTVTTVHDMCFLFDSRFSRGSIIHSAQVWMACMRSSRLICVSRFTFDMLSAWSPHFARKARVVHNGIEARTQTVDEARLRLEALGVGLAPLQYLVWVGSPGARKNVGFLFDVFSAHYQRLPNHKFAVVAPAAAHADLRARAEAKGFLPALRLFSGINDVSRDALYRCALALIFPSACEGFGYPVLEAMFQGCPPVSLRNSPAFELIGSGESLASELSLAEFTDILGRIGALPEAERLRLADILIARAAQFSAKAMATGTLEVLRTAAETL